MHTSKTAPKTRIDHTFDKLKQAGKKALIPYIMAGDPNPSVTVDLMHDLVKHGADVIELGMPFSDPMADGQTIAQAGERALQHGTSTHQAIEMVAQFRKTDQTTPVLLMGYLNPVEIMGYDRFVDLCYNAGVDGVLLVDMPVQQAEPLIQALADLPINPIFLITPTTQPKRQQQILRHASGFIYYVSLKGVTGADRLDPTAVQQQVADLKTQTPIPVCVGFGIRDGESAKIIGKTADGVIVGSELVKHFADVGDDPQKIAQARSSLLAKMDELKLALESLTSA